MEDSMGSEHGRCHERGRQELRKIRRLAAAPGGQSGKAVRRGQLGRLGIRLAGSNIRIALMVSLKVGPGVDADLHDVAQEFPAVSLHSLVLLRLVPGNAQTESEV